MNFSNFKIKRIVFGVLCAIASLSSCNMQTKELHGDPNNNGNNPYYGESEIEYELETKTNRSRKSSRPINITLNTNNQNSNKVVTNNRSWGCSLICCCCSIPCTCCCCTIVTVLGVAGFSTAAYFAGLAWGWWAPVVVVFPI